jgi:CMP-N,N'-diacetyllegionaminic acid synthase
MSTLAIIPARGGSKRLPDKNVKELAGLPLVVHSLRLAGLCPEIARTIVSTDSAEIAAVARSAGGDVPFLRPAELGNDETPTWPVVVHALEQLDADGAEYDLVLLLDPTSPARLPEDVARAHELLAADPEADGVVAVSKPSFNPIWTSVAAESRYLELVFPSARDYGRSQDAPAVLRINAALYLFRAEFVRRSPGTWLDGRHLALEIPEVRAFDIDTEMDFRLSELVLREGLVRLPWLEQG